MALTDKILLGLLLLLLPLGLLVAKQVSEPGEEVMTREEQLKKIEELLAQLADDETVALAPTPEPQETMEIVVDSVTVSSDSALLRISGKAPSAEALLYFDIGILPDSRLNLGNTIAVRDPDALAWPVQRMAIRPKANGDFTFEHIIEEEVGLLTVQVSQDGWYEQVEYDLSAQKWVE